MTVFDLTGRRALVTGGAQASVKEWLARSRRQVQVS